MRAVCVLRAFAWLARPQSRRSHTALHFPSSTVFRVLKEEKWRAEELKCLPFDPIKKAGSKKASQKLKEHYAAIEEQVKHVKDYCE